MRVLKIRGENLASLPSFEVDFTQPPFTGSGLFAISGPTGAGKSTILDALCVALFGKTPRLSDHGGVLIGTGEEATEQKIASNDTRSLMRKGAASAMAEVDFEGRDGRRYRAAWRIRRAGNKAGGRLQKQEETLFDLESGRTLSDRKKSECHALIERKLGLTYDQFCRAVLLAQGEFAVFLKAKDDERALLLERITGVDIYTKLSKKAHERQRNEAAELARIGRSAEEIVLLNDEARKAKEGALGEASARLAEAQSNLRRIEAADAWHRDDRRMSAELIEAETVHESTVGALAGASGVEKTLSDLETLEPIRRLIETVDRTLTAASARRRNLEALNVELTGCVACLEQAERALAERVAVSAAAEAAIRDGAPVIRSARALDVRIEQAQAALDDADRRLSEARVESGRLAVERASLAAALEANEKSRAAFELALQELTGVEPVAAEWGRWQAELVRIAGKSGLLVEATSDGAALERAAIDAEAAEAAALEWSQSARKGHDEAERAWHESRRLLSAVDPEGLRVARGVSMRKRDLLLRIDRAGTDIMEAAETIGRFRSQRDAALAEAARGEADRAMFEIEKAKAQAARDEAERALRLARSAMDLVAHRLELAPGRPCPLCGATEHPWVSGEAPGAALIEEYSGRERALRSSVETWSSRIAAAGALVESRRADANRSVGQLAEWSARREAAEAGWRAAAAEVKEADPDLALPGEIDPAALEEIRSMAEAASCEFEEVERREGECRLLQVDEGRQREARERTREALDRADEAARNAKSATVTAANALASNRDAQARLRGEIDLHLDALAAPFGAWPGWREGVLGNPARFLEEAGDRVAGLVEKRSGLEEISSGLERLRNALSTILALAGNADATLSSLADEEAGKRETRERLVAERSRLLGGRDAAEVERSLADAAVEARASEGCAAAGRDAAKGRQGTLLGQAKQERESLAIESAEAVLARKSLDEALLATGRTEPEVRALFAAHDADWLTEARSGLSKLREARSSAAALLGERDRKLRSHREHGAPSIDETDIPEAASKGRASLEACERERADLALELRLDDEKRTRLAVLAPELAVLRKRCDLWRGMSELIGAADGKKFRVYAQGLTLDHLLALANRQLRSLAPRFALLRVPGASMELQVLDREMGDDIRSVNNISGGETFLLSLALALGLSSLASGNAAIGSLFIDEGFGSLDEETLSTALSTLDALQASGRMIGVISHVPGLKEQIGTRIEVVPCGGGRSRVDISGRQTIAQIGKSVVPARSG